MKRLRIKLAMLLCRGTACSIVRDRPTLMMLTTVGSLAEYVRKSGGLTTVPNERRLRAYKTLLQGTEQILGLGRLVLAGPFPEQYRAAHRTKPTVEIESAPAEESPVKETANGKAA